MGYLSYDVGYSPFKEFDISRYTDGCLDKLLSWGEGQCIMIAGVAVGGAVLHILGINANII